MIGDNGVLTKAKKSSTKTTEARFLEDAGMAYSEIYAEEVVKPGFTGVTEAQVVTKLKTKYGYTIEPSTTGSITAIAPAKASTEIGVGDTDTIEITPDNANGNYVKLNGAYYKINLSSSNVTLGEAQNSIGGSGDTFEIIDATSSDTNVATVTKGKDTVTITGAGSGTATITVKYTDSITTTINVEVKGKYTITVAAADNNGTVSGGGTFVEGTSIEISATGNTGYTFEEWNDGNKENPRTIEVSSTTAGTYTATFEEKAEPVSASTIAAAPATYYGNAVTYEGYSSSYNSGWEIFHVTSSNIYLIATGTTESMALSNKITGYNGTSDFVAATTATKNISNFPAVADGWLNKTYNNSTSTVTYSSSYDGMKATEYLLDSTSVWDVKYGTSNSEWVIGGPTLELLVASYNAKNSSSIMIGEPYGSGYPGTFSSRNIIHSFCLESWDKLLVGLSC